MPHPPERSGASHPLFGPRKALPAAHDSALLALPPHRVAAAREPALARTRSRATGLPRVVRTLLCVPLLALACRDPDDGSNTATVASDSTGETETSEAGTTAEPSETEPDASDTTGGDGPTDGSESSGTGSTECVPIAIFCGDSPACFGDLLYPTDCGPLNCEEPLGPCPNAGCDPSLFCADVQICVRGMLYPTSCGPDNCDMPTGTC